MPIVFIPVYIPGPLRPFLPLLAMVWVLLRVTGWISGPFSLLDVSLPVVALLQLWGQHYIGTEPKGRHEMTSTDPVLLDDDAEQAATGELLDAQIEHEIAARKAVIVGSQPGSERLEDEIAARKAVIAGTRVRREHG